MAAKGVLKIATDNHLDYCESIVMDELDDLRKYAHYASYAFGRDVSMAELACILLRWTLWKGDTAKSFIQYLDNGYLGKPEQQPDPGVEIFETRSSQPEEGMIRYGAGVACYQVPVKVTATCGHTPFNAPNTENRFGCTDPSCDNFAWPNKEVPSFTSKRD